MTATTWIDRLTGGDRIRRAVKMGKKVGRLWVVPALVAGFVLLLPFEYPRMTAWVVPALFGIVTVITWTGWFRTLLPTAPGLYLGLGVAVSLVLGVITLVFGKLVHGTDESMFEVLLDYPALLAMLFSLSLVPLLVLATALFLPTLTAEAPRVLVSPLAVVMTKDDSSSEGGNDAAVLAGTNTPGPDRADIPPPPMFPFQIMSDCPSDAQSLGYGLLFGVGVHANWFVLVLFVLAGRRFVSSTAFSVVGVLAFHSVRSLFYLALSEVSGKLPRDAGLLHTPDLLQLMSFVFYRLTFLATSSWPQTIVVALASSLVMLASFPGRMTQFYYEHVSVPLHHFAESYLPGRLVPAGPTPYEVHISQISVRYYYEQIAEYYSMATFVLYSSVIRLSSNANLYYFATITQEEYLQLLYRFLFLFLFELCTDVLVRIGTRTFLDLDIAAEATLQTVGSKSTRILFSKVITFCLLCAYLTSFGL